jgi:hypothetical protein
MPPSPPDPRRLPSLGFAQQEEAARQLTAANIQFRRGQMAEAEKSVTQILQARPDTAEAHELLADIRLSRHDYEGATESLKQALHIEPGRASAEAKLARAALRQYETERLKTTGAAYAASEPSLMRRMAGDQKNGRMAGFASALIPGLGQYLNGEPAKGIVLAAVYFLALILLSLMLAPSAHGRLLRAPSLNGVSWFLIIAGTADWLYAVVDAALASQRTDAASRSGKDRGGGWQV